MERESARRPSFKERERDIVTQSDQHSNCFKGSDGGKLLRDGMERIIIGFYDSADTIFYGDLQASKDKIVNYLHIITNYLHISTNFVF